MTTISDTTPVIALAGNPNVGKSTLFNALTGLRQHTGNWPGKTVSSAQGSYTYEGKAYTLVDLPGTYSLHPSSAEEEVTREYLLSHRANVTLVVADATCLERNLALVLQILETTWPVVLCINLLDEASKRGIQVDLPALQQLLGCPVVGTSARGRQGLPTLRRVLADTIAHPPVRPTPQLCTECLHGDDDCRAAAYMLRATALSRQVTSTVSSPHRRDQVLDRIVISRSSGIPVMLALLALILWLTMAGANIPSQWLNQLLFSWQEPLRSLLQSLHFPWWLEGALVDGIYRTVAWVVSVMLPPMAIFFPLFTLLEEAGYLPRVAFNLDRFFCRAGAHGRQSLTMCMGLGCNACGVMGCRIIQSERERLIAIITNALIPCNGKFPTLIALISLFFVTGTGIWGSLQAAAGLAFAIVLAVIMTLFVSRLLSSTVLKGTPSYFSLELPPYRAPRVAQVLIRSILDRTIFVLGRAVAVAAPAGLIIWISANITVGGSSILLHLANFLEPAGRLLGLDGIVLLAILMGFPANEIVVPAMLMGYLSTGSLTEYASLTQLQDILIANGWTVSTALCMLFLTLFHFPCGTTCLTIWRETKSIRWTVLSIALPTLIGISLCLTVQLVGSLFS